MSDERDVDREIARMDADARIKSAAERIRFQQESAMAVIKGLTFANGGAILALLTFVGNHSTNLNPGQLRSSFTAFAAGLALALSSYVGAYFSQGSYSHSETSDSWNHQSDMRQVPRLYTEDANKERRTGTIFEILGVACVVASLISFVVGAFSALNSIT